jgi:hypothetical protein
VRFEIYEMFISLIFQFFSGHGKPQITETADTESADTGAQPYYVVLRLDLG